MRRVSRRSCLFRSDSCPGMDHSHEGSYGERKARLVRGSDRNPHSRRWRGDRRTTRSGPNRRRSGGTSGGRHSRAQVSQLSLPASRAARDGRRNRHASPTPAAIPMTAPTTVVGTYLEPTAPWTGPENARWWHMRAVHRGKAPSARPRRWCRRWSSTSRRRRSLRIRHDRDLATAGPWYGGCDDRLSRFRRTGHRTASATARRRVTPCWTPRVPHCGCPAPASPLARAVVRTGYSQGGMASAAAAELQPG